MKARKYLLYIPFLLLICLLIFTSQSLDGTSKIEHLVEKTQEKASILSLQLSIYREGDFAYDICKVFDIIFTMISVAILSYILYTLYQSITNRLRPRVLILHIMLMVFLLIGGIIGLSIVFQTNFFTIVRVWAPYSMAGAFILLAVDIV